MASQDSPKTPETSPGGGAGGAHWEQDENGDYILVADAESGSSGGPGGIPLGPILGGAGAGAAAGTVAGTVLGNSNAYPDVPGTPNPPAQGPKAPTDKTLLGIPTSVWGDILGGVIGLAGTKIATNASGDASRAQLEALDRATALQREMYQQSRSDQLPWLKAGTGALSMLSHGLGLPNVDIPTVGTNGLPQTPKQNPVNAQNPQGFQISPDGQTGTGSFSLRQLQGLPPSTGSRSGGVVSPPSQGQAPKIGGDSSGSLNGSMSALQPVTMRTPSGSIIQVPQQMVAEATAKGAVPA